MKTQFDGHIRLMGRSYYVVIPAASVKMLVSAGEDPKDKLVTVEVKL